MGIHWKAGTRHWCVVNSEQRTNIIMQVIHPGQVSVVQEAFSPSEARVEWATALVEEHARHQEGGRGAFSFRGAMIDMPTVKQAENVLRIQQRRP